ncbi:MAG TPA: hypothetical protein VN541_10910 [Tepidisphaeraceae bacterium]|nr:hypothetical protein [Tepidisphaeraceae bacterium]
MLPRIARTWLIGTVVTLASACPAWAAEGLDKDGAASLAWRLDAISSTTVGPTQPAAAWRRSAALLDAASRLDPAELRFLRLRVLALIQVGDTDEAVAAVRAYRKAAIAQHVPDPQAQIQLIDLYASKEQTLDAKLGYLQSLLGLQNVPPEVRAHAAVQCAGLLAQKSRDQAVAMLKRAVEIYPLPDATRQYYEMAGRQLPFKEKLAALLAVLRANPSQPTYLAELGQMLAQSGWAEQSLRWYDLAIATIMRSGSNRPPEFHACLIDYASELIISGHGSASDTLLGQMLDEQPLDPDAWFLKLTESKASSQQVTYQQTLELARNALVRRWNLLHDEILNGPSATSQPAASQPSAEKVDPLDPQPVLQKLKGANNARGQDAVVGAVSDLAWFELYYAKNAAGAKPWIDVLATLLTPESAELQRLAGWHALAAGQTAQAHEMLSKIADKDALAELGVLKATQAASQPVDDAAARKLLEEHRTGLLGAVLWDALRDQKTLPATQPAAMDAKEQIEKFPAAFLTLLDPRQVRQVYEIRSEPLEPHVGYGDPMLLRVTITNTGDADVTISRDGLLRPDLWFDAQILGLDQQSFRGVAYDQIANQIVLRPHTSASQVVRLDEGDLRKVLDVSPGAQTRVTSDVLTNPVTIGDSVAPGPAGTAAQARSMLYVGIPITLPMGRKQIDAALASSSPADKLRALDLIASYLRAASRPDVDPTLKQATADLPQVIERMKKDPAPVVSAWAEYLSATIGTPEQARATANEMASSANWTTRLLALFADASLPVSEQKAIAAKLAEDPDATVKSAGGATLKLLEAPTTQPTSQPSTAPAA